MASTSASMHNTKPHEHSKDTLKPTWTGYIENTEDAAILCEAVFMGVIQHIGRRPHDKERAEIIKSGSVFIHEAGCSGVKRWTDGRTWSPSRMHGGNFLIYREMATAFKPGQKKKAMPKEKRQGIQKKRSAGAGISMNGVHIGRANSSAYGVYHNGALTKEQERALIGSLVDSYDFKDDDSCLLKKTISIDVADQTHHIVSYYTIADVLSGKLLTPRADPRFEGLKPRSNIIHSKSFKQPPEDFNFRSEDDDMRGNHFSYRNNSDQGGYDYSNQYSNRTMPRLPAPAAHGLSMPYQSNNFPLNSQFMMGINPAPYNLTYNGGLPAVGSGDGSYSSALAGAIPNTMSPYNGGIPATSPNTNFSYQQYAPAPGTYETLKLDPYDEAHRQQRHHSIATIPTIPNMNTTPLAPRSMSYSQQSLVTGMPEALQRQTAARNPHETGMFSNPFGSRNPNESTHTYNLYQPRDTPSNSLSYSQQQRILSASNPSYNPQSANQYTQHMGASSGNASTGHAHYMDSQGPW